MSIEISYDRAVELLNRAVEEKGADYVYPRNEGTDGPQCTYVRDGAPSCIVGHILHYAGVSIESLKMMDEDYFVATIGSIVRDGAFYDHDIEVTDTRVVGLLVAAQESQDNGDSWGHARAKALMAQGA